MILWRISNWVDLKGIGGIQHSGRWHSGGTPIVYLSEHPALSLLEVRVHLNLNMDKLPSSFQLLKVEFDYDAVATQELMASSLSEQWRESYSYTQPIGDQWLEQGSSVLLKVPSAVLPESSNYLFNPLHPDANEFKIIRTIEHPFDLRLFE